MGAAGDGLMAESTIGGSFGQRAVHHPPQSAALVYALVWGVYTLHVDMHVVFMARNMHHDIII